MKISPFKAIFPKTKVRQFQSYFFSTVKQKFNQQVQAGYFGQFKTPGLYAYQIKSRHKVHSGIVCGLNIEDFIEGKVIKHEKILDAKAQESIDRILGREAMLKPVLLTYPPVKSIREMLDGIIQAGPPTYAFDFEEDETLHQIWDISDSELGQALISAFDREVPIAYIADGHHRSETMARLYTSRLKSKKQYDFSHVLCALFDFSQMEIHDYNRIVEVLNFHSPTSVVARISQIAKIIPLKGPQKPRQKGEMTMMINGEWYKLKWRKSAINKVKDRQVILDTHLFNQLVLKDIFGIMDIESDMRVKYVAGVSGIQFIHEKTAQNDIRMAFCLYPVHMNDFKALSDCGELMPPKSTWFEPRLINGVIIQSVLNETV